MATIWLVLGLLLVLVFLLPTRGEKGKKLSPALFFALFLLALALLLYFLNR